MQCRCRPTILLTGSRSGWPDRAIVLQAHRGNEPVAYHNFALRTKHWKLLNASGFHQERFEGEPHFELYDMLNDPLEMHNLAADPAAAGKLKELKKEHARLMRRHKAVPDRMPLDGGIINVLPKF